jgi:hypothetical protein
MELRNVRFLLDYRTIGVRNATIRQDVRVALAQYRARFSDLTDAIVSGCGGGGHESRSRVLASVCHRRHGFSVESISMPPGRCSVDRRMTD